MLDRPLHATQPPPTAVRRARSPPERSDDAAGLNGAQVLAALRRRRSLLLASILPCPALTGLAITQITPRYTATGKLLYDPSGYKLQELQSILQVDPMTDAVMASQAEVLRGMPVVEQVTRQLNLLTNPVAAATVMAPTAVARRSRPADADAARSGRGPDRPQARPGP